MANRFTDTEKWKKPFIRGLEAPLKLLWFYICDDCDHAGIWQVDMEVAEIRTGEKISLEKAIKEFDEKIIIFDNGSKWFLPSFIEFQYPSGLQANNKAHAGIIKKLQKYGLIDEENKPYQKEVKGLQSPFKGSKDNDKELGIGIGNKEGGMGETKKEINVPFETFWDLYDKKVGEKTKLQKKWEMLTDNERTQAINHIHLYKQAQPDKQYRKDPATYLNNKSFNDEIIQSNGQQNNSTSGGRSVHDRQARAVAASLEFLEQLQGQSGNGQHNPS